MFRGRRVRWSLVVIATSVLCAASAVAGAWAAKPAPGVDTSYGDGGVVSLDSRVPAGYRELSYDEWGIVLAGARGSTIYVSELSACASPAESHCGTPAVARRIGSDGSLDTSYGKRGALDIGALGGGAVATDPRGRLIVAKGDGFDAEIRRFTVAGKPDRRFGFVTIEGLGGGAHPKAILSAPHGRLIIAAVESIGDGESQGAARVTLVRLLPDGRIDRTYGRRGRSVVDIATNLEPRIYSTPSGATLVVSDNCCGESSFTPVERVSAKGRLDVRFDARARGAQVDALAGLADPMVEAAVARGDGTVELFGSSGAFSAVATPDFALRLTADGRVDTPFGERGLVKLANAFATAATGSGGATIALFRRYDGEGTGRGYAQRLLADGALDQRFGGEAGVELPAAGTPVEAVVARDGRTTVLERGPWASCEPDCGSAAYLVRLIEPSAGGGGKGGKDR
jgi:hypothetical protein